MALAGSGMMPGPGTPASSGGSVMVTPILGYAGSTTGPSNTLVNFAPLYNSANITAYSASDVKGTPIAAPGSVSNLSVRMPLGIGGGSYVITLDKNAVGTTLTCTLNSGTTCVDNTHTISVVAGDVLSWSFTPSGTPTQPAAIQIAAVFTSTNNGEGFIAAPYVGNDSTSAVNFQGFAAIAPNATEVNISSLMPTAGNIDHLYVNASVAPGASKDYSVALCKNGVCAGTPTCLITGASGAGSTSCSDLVTAATSFAKSDTMSIMVCPGTISAGTCTPVATPTASAISAGFRWVPTIAGEALLFQTPSAIPTGNVAQFGNINGSGYGGTETNFSSIAPVGITIKKLNVSQSTAPGGAATHTTTLRANSASVGTPGNVSCQITSAITACSDATNSYSAATNDLLDLTSIGVSSPAAMTWFKAGLVVTSP